MRPKILSAKELIEVRNLAENTVYTGEKLIRENGEKIPADVKQQVEDGMAAVRAVKDGEDAEAIKKATEELSQNLQKVGASMYQQPAGGAAGPGAEGSVPPDMGGDAPPQEPPAEGGTGGGEDVVDGEFKNI